MSYFVKTIIIVIPFILSYESFCMEDVILDDLLKLLDPPSANSFFQTCKKNQSIYNNEEPLDTFLRKNKDSVFCAQYFRNNYVNVLVHFSQKNNVEMTSYLISNEDDKCKKERTEILKLFHYDTEDDLKNPAHTIRAYRGIKKGFDRLVEEDLFKILESNFSLKTHALLIFLKNGVSANITKADNFTLLHIAASIDEIEIARILIEHGADVTQATFFRGFPPLMFSWSYEMKQLLLEPKPLKKVLSEHGLWSNVFLEHLATKLSCLLKISISK